MTRKFLKARPFLAKYIFLLSKLAFFDFNFLYETKLQQAGSNGANEPSAGTKEVQRVGSNPPPPIPRPDPNDPEVGHFCAPFCPGFCEANFCIFHCPPSSMGQKVVDNGEK